MKMKLELLIVLNLAIVYSVSGITIPKGANKFKGRASATVVTPKPKPPREENKAEPRQMASGDTPAMENGSDMPDVQEPNYETMKTHICNSVKTMPGKGSAAGNMTLEMEMTENEVYELMMTTMTHGLHGDSVLTFLPENLQWMKQVLDIISSITKMTCSDFVPVEYINIAKNLFMYYVYKNSFQESMIDPVTGEEVKPEPPNQEKWDAIVDMLHNCHEQTFPLIFSSECSTITYVLDKQGTRMFIEPSEEHYDRSGIVFGEEVIDAVWHMFSLAYARSYSYSYPLEGVVFHFLEHFKKEFLAPLYPRWLMSNTYNSFFPMIMGNFNLLRAKRNLRSCVAAVYMFEDIEDRQLVRPLPISINDEPMPNFKTGRSLF